MHNLTLAQVISGLNQGDFSSLEITQHYLNRIGALDSRYNSYITVTGEQALSHAKQADENRAKGITTLLGGAPITHKDIFCTKGIKTSCGSKMLDNFISPYDATVVSKLRDAGAVSLGKANMDEFAMGSSNETSFYGKVLNPWDLGRVPGGSSGGSAAAVAARLTPVATATDTGGSIRQPASLCGLTGLKPTYGRVSRFGMIAFASSLDQAGPMARTAEDAAIMLNAMAGVDSNDSTSADKAVDDYTAKLNNDISGLRIGVPKEFFTEGLNAATQAKVQDAIKQYEKLGAKIIEISLPHTALAVPAYYVIAPAEASANLSRFDGVRYGYRCEDPADLQDLYMRTREEGFGEEVKRRILIGAYVLSAGFYDAYYNKAQRIRRLIKNDFEQAFKQVDLIIGPTSPSPAFKIGEKNSDPVQMYLEDIYTISTNLAGLPALSMPAGLAGGLPVGVQLIGNYFDESTLLNAAHRFQMATDHHQQSAPNLEVGD
ncbi:MAG: aspartyl-tRNA(Asn)/glutamyl-tRNA(Gln) amidotransferase subunit A [Chitinophagales bacterium]|jgi:aspartyl-tRNA(Asn)/glutamyl-tRNA(Gln) amidotransferase subunit A